MGMSDEAIARVAHLVNKACCEAFGDHSQPCWEKIPEWQKTSTRNSISFLRNHPEATPQSLHEEWMHEKQENGWSYGPVKDEGKKQHPSMLPFAELSQLEQAKDYIFLAVVRALDADLSGDNQLS